MPSSMNSLRTPYVYDDHLLAFDIKEYFSASPLDDLHEHLTCILFRAHMFARYPTT